MSWKTVLRRFKNESVEMQQFHREQIDAAFGQMLKANIGKDEMAVYLDGLVLTSDRLIKLTEHIALRCMDERGKRT